MSDLRNATLSRLVEEGQRICDDNKKDGWHSSFWETELLPAVRRMRNEIIEECAKVCDDYEPYPYGQGKVKSLANRLRDLKETRCATKHDEAIWRAKEIVRYSETHEGPIPACYSWVAVDLARALLAHSAIAPTSDDIAETVKVLEAIALKPEDKFSHRYFAGHAAILLKNLSVTQSATVPPNWKRLMEKAASVMNCSNFPTDRELAKEIYAALGVTEIEM